MSVAARQNNVQSFPIPSHSTDAEEVRAAARQLASGVSVVTIGSGEDRAGLTAVSVALLSPDPATLVVCVRRVSGDYAALARSKRFAVNVLGGDQREIAEHFGGSPAGSANEPSVGSWLPLSEDLSCLADCAAVFECETEETIERNDNAIVIGRVKRAVVGGGSGALVRWRGAYDQLGWSRDEISRAVGLRPANGA